VRSPELAKMFDLEDTYWWFVARRELVRAFLESAFAARPNPLILDVGCGTGATLKALVDLGPVVGVDRAPDALRYCRRRGLRSLSLATAEALPITSDSADAILALDLLEHVADDAAALREFARVLRPGGILLITVPACPQLWSEHDEALDHLRRYRLPHLRRILLSAGLRIDKLSYLITSLLAPIAALRLLQRLIPRRKRRPRTAFIVPPRPINWLLIALLRLERRWLSRFGLPIGVSLIAIARKP